MKFFLLFLAFLLLLSGCNTPRVINQTHRTDSTIVREVPKIITVPGSTAQSPKINLDSLVQLIRSGIKPEVINNTLYHEDPETKLRVGLLIDELGNLTALCEQQDRHIETLEKQIEHWQKEYEKVTVYVEPSLWDRIRTFANTFGILVVAALILILFLRR